MSDYKIKDLVRIKGSPNKGVITKISNKGASVEIEGKTFIISLDQIVKVDLEHKEDKKKKVTGSNQISKKVFTKNTKIPKLDLHGMTKAQAREEILNFISSSILNEIKIIEIIHGHGDGILKKEVNQILKKLDVIRAVKAPEDMRASIIVYL